MKLYPTSRGRWVWPLIALLVVTVVLAGITLSESTPASAQDAYPALGPLPPVPQPEDNPITAQKAELGRLLYFDPRMSADSSMSLNTRYPAADGWGARTPIALGGPGVSHWRNALTLLNAGYYDSLGWDGAFDSLEAMNDDVWSSPAGGNIDRVLAEERLAQVPDYVERFGAVFGTDTPQYDDALRAVATYQRTVNSINVPFDRFVGGEEDAISDAAKAGYELFTGEAGCIACHNGPLASDGGYHATGVPQNPDFLVDPLKQISFRYAQTASGIPEAIARKTSVDLGRYYVTQDEGDMGKFLTPSLRDLCYTSPYMHNGLFNTLDEVVAFYNEGGGDGPNIDPLMQPLGLDETQQSNLVEFLVSLCGDPVMDQAPELPPYAVFAVSEDE